jgi:hypothetical protein
MRGRYLSTKNHPLEARRWYQSRSALSTIRGLTMPAMTSMNTDDASTGTLRSEATVLTVVDAMTAMRTGWL